MAPKPLSTEEFIAKAKAVHGDKYSYSKTRYFNNRTNVIITCPIHGDFEQIPSNHLNGHHCKKCYCDSRKMTTDDFIAKAKLVHDNSYDYSKTVYTGTNNKLTIICPIHGEFEQRAQIHLQGRGCKQCSYENYPILTTSWFKEKAKLVHGDKYDYSKSIYAGSNKKIIITCPVHGDFRKMAQSHLQGFGCNRCRLENHNRVKIK